jgi:hypothetical protein
MGIKDLGSSTPCFRTSLALYIFRFQRQPLSDGKEGIWPATADTA